MYLLEYKSNTEALSHECLGYFEVYSQTIKGH